MSIESMRRTALLSSVLILGFHFPAGAALADEPCMDFKWDVSRERALYETTAAPQTAGTDFKFSPVVFPERLYQLKLADQEKVTFSVMPGKKPQNEGMHAGLVYLRIAVPGNYRISSDVSMWVDVVAHGALLEPKDFQGQHGCSAPHKIVEFEFGDAATYILQFSAAAPDSIKITVTPSPRRTL